MDLWLGVVSWPLTPSLRRQSDMCTAEWRQEGTEFNYESNSLVKRELIVMATQSCLFTWGHWLLHLYVVGLRL